MQGSKNAVLPILAASILHAGTTVLHNCPQIADVETMLEILTQLGCRVKRYRDTLEIDASFVQENVVAEEITGKMRSSVLLLGAMLGRAGKVCICYPGGCVIGKRPIDLHLAGLRKMGARFAESERMLCGSGKLKGACVRFPFCSVGATENLILAAVCAEGTTALQGFAREPEIRILCQFLRKMGVSICRKEDSLMIAGGCVLRDTEFTIPGDRIVAGTYALAAAGTKGCVRLRGICRDDFDGQLDLLANLGVEAVFAGDCMNVDARRGVRPVPFVETSPYPGFPTDLQSPLMAALCTADGVSYIRETIFESRFGTVAELQKLGADITVVNDGARIIGTSRLRPGRVCARDLRGGAALVIAGLMTEGETTIGGVSYIERGYEDICRDLRDLGADIRIRESMQ